MIVAFIPLSYIRQLQLIVRVRQYRGNSRNAAHSVGHDMAVALSTRLDRPLKTASGWSRLSISNSDSGFARKFNIVQ